MEDALIALIIVPVMFLGLPWLILHYVTQWKKGGAALALEDEKLLNELHELGRRLDDRVGTIERIMTAENPGWRQLAQDPAGLGIEDRDMQTRGRIVQ